MAPAAKDRDGLRIGELARRTAASTRSLRYYEQRGLITSDREDNGYRRYTPDVATTVANIRLLLSAGLSIDDISQFGHCVHSPSLDAAPCAAALDVYEQRLAALRSRIDTLEHLHATLAEHTERLRGQLQV